jgi:hypothetical protein
MLSLQEVIQRFKDCGFPIREMGRYKNKRSYVELTCSCCGKKFLRYTSEICGRQKGRQAIPEKGKEFIIFCGRKCAAVGLRARTEYVFNEELLLADIKELKGAIIHFSAKYPPAFWADLEQVGRIQMLKVFERAQAAMAKDGKTARNGIYMSNIMYAMRNWMINNVWKEKSVYAITNDAQTDDGFLSDGLINETVLEDSNFNLDDISHRKYLYRQFNDFCNKEKDGFILKEIMQGATHGEIMQKHKMSTHYYKRLDGIKQKFREKFKTVIAEWGCASWDEAEWG